MAATRVSGRNMVGTLASVDDIWRWLDTVPDPEIPAISLVDLGIIRNVTHDADTAVITVTPTYSGCPATSIISLDIETELRKRGVENVRIERQLTPAWTTDWLSVKGRTQLEAYGIAPPSANGPERCPQCKSTNLNRVSQFGSTPCKALWRCLNCGEPFDFFKCI